MKLSSLFNRKCDASLSENLQTWEGPNKIPKISPCEICDVFFCYFQLFLFPFHFYFSYWYTSITFSLMIIRYTWNCLSSLFITIFHNLSIKYIWITHWYMVWLVDDKKKPGRFSKQHRVIRSTTDWCISIYDLPYRFAREEYTW